MLDIELWNRLYNFETHQEPFWVHYQNRRRLKPNNKKRLSKSYKRMKSKQQKAARKLNR